MTGDTASTQKISISVNSSSSVPLVFDINAAKKMREMRILGVLSGSLPTAAQQNVFLNIPFRLMCEEAVWLVCSGNASLVCDDDLLREALSTFSQEELERWQLEHEKSMAAQLILKKQQYIDKNVDFGKINNNYEDFSLLEQALFIETDNNSKLIRRQVRMKNTNQLTISVEKKIINRLIERYLKINDYLLFKSLRDSNYFLSPGGRFGARYMAYPGDPLRYHSHMAVQPALDYYEEPLDLLNLVSGGRLGTGVKKLWVVGGVRYNEIEELPCDNDERISALIYKDEVPISFFSIEWSGFG